MSASEVNIFKFRGSIQKMIDIVGIRKRAVMQKVALDLHTKITLGTPVDTGRARANWDITEGAPSDKIERYEGAKTGEVPLPEPPDVKGLSGDAPIYIINNLPYIIRLENGHSSQAPDGMVRLAIQAETAELDKVIASVKGKR